MKTYVVTPSFSISPGPRVEGSLPIPSDGRYQLGDILTEPFGPRPTALNRYDRTPIDEKYLEAIDDKEKVELNSSDLWRGRLGIWTSILANLGIGAAMDLSVHAKHQSTDLLTIETLETREMDVREDYIREVLASRSVDDYIKQFSGKDGRKLVPLYMVSGLKIAKGAKSTMSDLWKAGGNIGTSESLGNTNAKLVDFLHKRYRGLSFQSSRTDFVLAFQLVHIRYNVETKVLVTEDSVDKATLSDGSGTAAGPVVRLEGVDNDLVDAKPTDQEVLTTVDEAAAELVMIPDLK